MNSSGKKLLTLILSVMMMIGSINLGSISVHAESDSSGDGSGKVTEPLNWEDTDGKDIKSVEPKGRIDEAKEAGTEIKKNVRVSIIVDGASTIGAGYETEGIGTNPAAKNYRAQLLAKQRKLADAISAQALNGNKLDVVWNLTLAANIISANVPVVSIDAIKKVDGVVDVIVENQYDAVDPAPVNDPEMAVSSDMTSTSMVWSDYTGAGQSVAIVDTGLDTDHRSFDAEAFDYAISTLDKDVDLVDASDVAAVLTQLNSYIAMQGSLTADELYLSTKVPYAFNYVDIGLDVTHDNDEQGEHGSHVSGIAAANRYVKNADGEYVDALTEVKTQGQAPDAQIFTMKVFGKGGGAYDSDYFAAIEDAIVLGAASVNLSLGSSNAGFAGTSVYADILAELTESNTIAAMSAGNNYHWAEPNLGDLYSDDLNFTTGGSPGSFTETLNVASIDNDGYIGSPIVAGKKNIFFDDGSSAKNAPLTSIAGTYNYIAIKGFGTAEDMAALKDVLGGKVAVVSRGTNSFYVKANESVKNGAVATLIYNNAPGTLGMNLTGYEYTAPAASITQADGKYLISSGEEKTINGVTYYEGTMTIPSVDDIVISVDNKDYVMSDFSSWGGTGDLNMKPEITAPGGNIYSVNGAVPGGQAYEIMSGTSMASPQIAGITAVVRQYIEENGLEEKTGMSIRQLTQSLLMSTATPVVDQTNGSYYPVMKQGSGLANVEAAVNSRTAITVTGTTNNGAAVEKAAYIASYKDGKVKALFGEDAKRGGKYTVSFDVLNFSDEDLALELGGDMFTQAVTVDDYGDEILSLLTQPLSTAVITYTVDGRAIGADSSMNGYDFNGDKNVDRYDAVALLEYVTGTRKGIKNKTFADLDKDGDIDTYDAYLALDQIGAVSVEVKAGKKVSVTASIDLNGSLDELGSEDRCGNYIEGYLSVQEAGSADGAEGVKHTIPVYGYFGSWSEASMTDKGSAIEYVYEEEERYPYMYPVLGESSFSVETFLVKFNGETGTYMFGGNPLNWDETYHPERNAISSKDTLIGPRYTLIRNSGAGLFCITADGEMLGGVETGSAIGAYYYRNGSKWYNTYTSTDVNFKAEGIKEGTQLEYHLVLAPEYYINDGKVDWDSVVNEAMSISAVVDNTAPVIDEDASVGVKNEETGAFEALNIVASDNEYISGVVLYDMDGNMINMILAGEEDKKGETHTYTFELAEDSSPYLYVEVYDYAMNKTVKKINLKADEEYADPEISITIDPEAATIMKGNSLQLNALVMPWGYNDNVTWTSSNEAIATVDADGIVTAVAVGSAVITAVPEADPEQSASCTVTVDSIEYDLNGIVWDENGQVWFSKFNTSTLPNYEKLSGSMKLPLASAAYDADGEMYAASFDTEDINASALYKIDESTYEATEIGSVGIGVMDMTGTPYLGNNMVAVYGPYVVLIDKTTGAYTGVFDFTDDIEGNLIGVAYEGTANYTAYGYGYTDFIILLDTAGNLYDVGLYYDTKTGKYIQLTYVTKIDNFGVTSDVYYFQSLYYFYDPASGDEYAFWSNYSEAAGRVTLYGAKIAYDAQYNMSFDGVFTLGSFAPDVWPVGGLYEQLGSEDMELSRKVTEFVNKEATMDIVPMEMYKAAKGSLNTVFAEGETADTEDEENVVSDVKVVTVTNENEDTNGLIVVEYDPEQLELVGSAGAVKYNAVYGGDEGKVRVGFINDEAIAAGTTIASLSFRVLDQSGDAYVTVVTEEENEEHPQTKKEILVNEITVVAVTDVTLSESDIILTEGKTAALTATVTPEEATNKEVRWISTSPAVATVAQDGTVTAVASGTTFILVSTVDGGHTAICKVTVDDKIQAFVRRLYTLCFNRNPDAGGFNNWTTQLRTKKITAAEAVRGFFLSKEMNNLNLSNEDFIERCYLVMMDRASDAGGKKYWLNKMNNGVPKLDILQGFVVSKEFTKICADFGIERGSLK